MHEYDMALKLLLQGSAELTMRTLVGGAVRRWLNIELPEVQITRMDLLGETVEGGLIHLELQSGHDADMALRMAEYCLRVYRRTRRFPRQIVLYVGGEPSRMTAELRGQHLQFRFELIDVRDLDGERLLSSDHIGDNVVAILTNLPDRRAAVQLILSRIAGLPAPQDREVALRQLLILAGLRDAEEFVSREAANVPILNDIRDHKVLGPVYISGFEQGREKGKAEGEWEGELKIVLRLIEERFGRLPAHLKDELGKRSSAELEALSLRILNARTRDELFT